MFLVTMLAPWCVLETNIYFLISYQLYSCLTFPYFWVPPDIDIDVITLWFSCSVHGHGRGTCRSPILGLSSAIERRARGLSFPLLRIFIGYQQLLQRAAWSAKSWQTTTVSNTTTHTDNYHYAQLSLYIVSSPLLTLYDGKRGEEGRKRWIHTYLRDLMAPAVIIIWIGPNLCLDIRYHNYVISRDYGFLVLLRHGSFDSHPRL